VSARFFGLNDILSRGELYVPETLPATSSTIVSNHPFLSSMISYDVASNMCQALDGGGDLGERRQRRLATRHDGAA
jgi:hypothetical protein